MVRQAVDFDPGGRETDVRIANGRAWLFVRLTQANLKLVMAASQTRVQVGARFARESHWLAADANEVGNILQIGAREDDAHPAILRVGRKDIAPRGGILIERLREATRQTR